MGGHQRTHEREPHRRRRVKIPGEGTRNAAILECIDVAPNGLLSAEVRALFPDVKPKFIASALNSLEERGFIQRTEEGVALRWRTVGAAQ